MQTLLSDLSKCGIAPFMFAGQTFPKHVWTLPRGKFADRLKRRSPVQCGDYYHAPTPKTGPSREGHGQGFYLASDGAPGLRWQWCDEVSGQLTPIRHTGWFCNDDCSGEKIRGVVFRLPHGRGFLAGWSMGEGMASAVECEVWADEVDCARAADRLAESVAEAEREREQEYLDSVQDELDAE